MQQTVESAKTLLVNGPASACVVSGKAEVFGNQVKVGVKNVVREGKRLPFYVTEKTVFDLSLGIGASVQEADGTTIPPSWSKTVEAVLNVPSKPVTVLVLGKIDSGKSSFCTYLVNSLLNKKCRMAVLDGDLGQADIGPSGTVGYACVSKPVNELYDLRLSNAVFIGETSPIAAIAKIIDGLTQLKAEVTAEPIDFLVVNTDGWSAATSP